MGPWFCPAYFRCASFSPIANAIVIPPQAWPRHQISMRSYQTADVISGLLSRNLLGTDSSWAENLLLEKFLFLGRIRNLYRKVRRPDGGPILDSLLKELRITYVVDGEDLAGIPRTGPGIVVANHPFGMLEGAILGAMLPGSVRM